MTCYLDFMPQTVTLTEFEASCADILHRARESGEEVMVFENGQPLAQVLPLPKKSKVPLLGAMAGTISITGDIISPACDESDWEVLR